MFSGQLIGLMSAWFRLYVNHVQSLCNAISHIFGVHDSVHSHSLFNVSHTKISRLKVPRTSRDHLGRLCLGNSPRSWRSIDMVCLHHVHNPIGETAQECGQAIRAWKNRSGDLHCICWAFLFEIGKEGVSTVSNQEEILYMDCTQPLLSRKAYGENIRKYQAGGSGLLDLGTRVCK